MARNELRSTVGARLGSFVANHPRLVATVLLLLALIVVQGGAAAADGTVDPTAFDSTVQSKGAANEGP